MVLYGCGENEGRFLRFELKGVSKMAKFLGDICSVCPNGETVEATFFVNRDF